MVQVRSLIICITAILFAVFGVPLWLTGSGVPGIVRAVAYPFFHANVFHLLANLLAVWTVFRPECRTIKRDLALGFLISTAVYFLATRPVVGLSNIMFAVIGLRTPAITDPWWRRPATITFLAVTLLMLLVPQFSAVTHIAAFAAGSLLSALIRIIKPYVDDAARLDR